MHLIKYYLFLFSQTTLIIFFLSSSPLSSKEKSIDACLNKKYDFICPDPFALLRNSGVDIDKDIIQLAKLQLFKQKMSNNLKGIFIDSNNTLLYIKQSNPVTELMGSRLMNLILGTKCTPVVKLVNDYKFTVASLELANFQTQKKIDITDKTRLGEADLAIAMDYIGLVDRHARNMGYVVLNSKTLLAARVDFDASFDFESNFFGEHSLDTNYLNLKHLYVTVNKYPKTEIINAMKKIISVSDEKIIMTIFQSWATLTRAGYVLDFNHCLAFAHQLVERKNAFKHALKDKNSVFNQLLEKKPIVNKKAKSPKKKHQKKRH